ncbi:Zinc finger A20 and AN1 domain-containing stress-associated protein 8 [Capsicum baccatum]|uniref:Zinc finger A20 and AN1 domain-containing stress-associated protein 8 n=1 Tax=Capsicum baccatum TaxID=33114 RepID=A0A2G2VCC8_CAPBA|nr:Zinc finger A20 and AN1 domain-containing stress-associated protein 8 [Capsicum baccatum]
MPARSSGRMSFGFPDTYYMKFVPKLSISCTRRLFLKCIKIGGMVTGALYLDVLTTQAENSYDPGKRLRSTNTGNKPIIGRSQLMCTGGSLMVTIQYSNDYKYDKNEALHTQYIFCTDVPHGGPVFHAAGTGCRAPEDPILFINDCDFFSSTATMNMCSKCQKDMILLKYEHAKLAAASRKDVVCKSSSSDESELALAGTVVASADLASQILQVNSKEGLKNCTTCHKRMGLTGFCCKCGDFFCAVHHYSDKHNCPFDYRNAGQNAIAKANPIIVA